jgi:putative intracellular protease/amidase
MELSGKTVAILATNGFEQSELEVPRDRLKQAARPSMSSRSRRARSRAGT